MSLPKSAWSGRQPRGLLVSGKYSWRWPKLGSKWRICWDSERSGVMPMSLVPNFVRSTQRTSKLRKTAGGMCQGECTAGPVS